MFADSRGVIRSLSNANACYFYSFSRLIFDVCQFEIFEFDELDLFPGLSWIFEGYKGKKFKFKLEKKIQSIQLEISSADR